MKYTRQEALLAGYTLLEDAHNDQKKENNNTLLRLVSEMNPFVWADRTTADPALWADWVKIAQKINEADELTTNEGFELLQTFLKYEKRHYDFNNESDYDAEKVISILGTPSYQERWFQLLDSSKEYLLSRTVEQNSKSKNGKTSKTEVEKAQQILEDYLDNNEVDDKTDNGSDFTNNGPEIL